MPRPRPRRASHEHCATPGVGPCVGWCGTHCGPKCCASDAYLKRKALESAALHARADPVVAASGGTVRVMLWQGEKNTVGRLGFMYWPVMGTLLEGFRHAPQVEVKVGVGFSLAYHSTLASLRRGDALVWVGVNGKNSQPWRELRARGVRTVMYNTEPVDSPLACARRQTVDEQWDFSRYNLARCDRNTIVGRPPRWQRYVPPGFLRSAAPARDGASRSMLLLGAVEEAGRAACFGELKAALGDRLERTYSVWNDTALDGLMARYEVFLNLHKSCRTTGPVTFRNALLLNAAKLIVSEHAHAADEEEYRGMIDFVPAASIPRHYEALVAGGDVARRRKRAAAHAKFRRRFAPRRLFERAGVYSDWNLSVG